MVCARRRAAQIGMDPALLHRVAVIGARMLDSLPHNGAVVTLPSVCSCTHGSSYKDVLMVVILGAIITFVVVIVLGFLVGSF
jgi:H+/gluconate symporter-like permease